MQVEFAQQAELALLRAAMQVGAAAQQQKDLAFGELLVAHLSALAAALPSPPPTVPFPSYASGGEGEGAGSGAVVAAMAARAKRIRAA